jgi:hypothetical protein
MSRSQKGAHVQAHMQITFCGGGVLCSSSFGGMS